MSAADIPPSHFTALSEEEGRAILRALAEIRAEPPPRDPRSLGCVGALLALGGLVALRWIAPALGLGTGLTWVVAAALAVILLLGGFLGVFGGGFVSGQIRGEVEEALTFLEEHYLDAPRDEIRLAAVRILWHAQVSVGPVSTSTFNTNEAAVQLGEALPYVQDVERFLLARGKVYPVFTLDL